MGKNLSIEEIFNESRELSLNGLRLLLYVKVLNKNSILLDKVSLEKVLKDLNVSKQAYYIAYNELVKKDLL